LRIVSNFHHLAGAGIDEALARFLPSATGGHGRTVASALDEQRCDDDSAADEQVHYRPAENCKTYANTRPHRSLGLASPRSVQV